MIEIEPVTWPPYCGTEYPDLKVAGDPVICDKPSHDPDQEKHRNSELQFEWWG